MPDLRRNTWRNTGPRQPCDTPHITPYIQGVGPNYLRSLHWDKLHSLNLAVYFGPPSRALVGVRLVTSMYWQVEGKAILYWHLAVRLPLIIRVMNYWSAKNNYCWQCKCVHATRILHTRSLVFNVCCYALGVTAQNAHKFRYQRGGAHTNSKHPLNKFHRPKW